MSRNTVRSWLVTAVMAVVCLGFTGFVAVVVTGNAPPGFTEKVRQTVRNGVNRVLSVFPHHSAPDGT